MKNGKTALKVTDQIELRLPNLIFAEELFELIDKQRVYLSKWLPWVDMTHSINQTQAFIKASKLYNKGGQRLSTFVFRNNELVGSIGLVKIDKVNKSAEIGYWLNQDYQGESIISKSCRVLINYTFKHMDINRLEIKAAIGNSKSLAIPKKLGFQHEAILREAIFIRDEFHDIQLFSLLKKEWNLF